RGEPLYFRSVGFPSPKPSPLPSTAWGCTPRPVAARYAAYRVFSENSQSLFKTFLSLQKNFRCLPCEISGFKSIFVAFPACFPRSKVLLRLARRGFALQKHFRGLSGAVSGFKSTFVASPACFQRSKVFSLLAQRIFGLQKHFRGFPDTISGFKSAFVASPAQFRASKALSLLPLRNFRFQKRFFSARAARISIRFRQKIII
ncbi:MAG: hypothetical protein HDR32_12115, partial [Treponema sp.]|nr:hypothetical protein [Treponema sp.]